MNAFQLIGSGFIKIKEYHKSVTFLWVINLIFAILIIHPYINSISNYFMNSAIIDQFLQNNFALIKTEFAAFNPTAFSMLNVSVKLGVIIYFFLSIALSGGFIGLLVRERGYKIASLLRSGFGNYKYLLLIAMIGVAGTLSVILLGVILFYLLTTILGVHTEPGYFYTLAALSPLLFVFYQIKDLLVDYMRIHYFRALGGEKTIHFSSSLKYVLSNIVTLIIYAFLMIVILIILIIAGQLLKGIFNSVNNFTAIYSFVISQVFLWLRVYWKAAFWAGEISLLEGPLGGKVSEKDLWPEDDIKWEE